MEFPATGTAGQSEHNKFLINIEQSEQDLTAIRSTIANDKFMKYKRTVEFRFLNFRVVELFFFVYL